ncbi:MAG: hypothetical protein MJE12_11085 [Alphaproteobacteria bacterium]|nr:hypothetical protein [Alphaproteobacteria bacterium]
MVKLVEFQTVTAAAPVSHRVVPAVAGGLRRAGEMPDERETAERENQQHAEEDQRAVFESAANRAFDTVQDPVGQHIQADTDGGERDEFH